VKYLLDVNVLVAALWSGHVHHDQVHRWLDGLAENDNALTCGLTEAGFLRVINAAYGVPLAEARGVLQDFKQRAGLEYLLELPSPVEVLPAWARSHKQVMDAYLVGLATKIGAKLGTLDRGIPGAKLLA
jgi:toxin-antitoxin system PIN domain toxin